MVVKASIFNGGRLCRALTLLLRPAPLAHRRDHAEQCDRSALEGVYAARRVNLVRPTGFEGVEHPPPLLVALERRQRERHLVAVGIQQHEERVADDWLAALINL